MYEVSEFNAVSCEADAFWSWFRNRRSSLEARLAASVAPGGEVSHLVLTQSFGDLMRALRDFDASLTPVLRRCPDGRMVFIVSADAAVEAFSSAKALVATAPTVTDWTIVALRPRSVPKLGRGRAAMLGTDDLRVAHGVANGRMTIALLGDTACVDPLEARHIARRLVAELLGEEDFALHVIDVAYLSLADWQAIAPACVSVPFAEFPAVFDTLFRRVASRPAPVVPAAPALVARVA